MTEIRLFNQPITLDGKVVAVHEHAAGSVEIKRRTQKIFQLFIVPVADLANLVGFVRELSGEIVMKGLRDEHDSGLGAEICSILLPEVIRKQMRLAGSAIEDDVDAFGGQQFFYQQTEISRLCFLILRRCFRILILPFPPECTVNLQDLLAVTEAQSFGIFGFVTQIPIWHIDIGQCIYIGAPLAFHRHAVREHKRAAFDLCLFRILKQKTDETVRGSPGHFAALFFDRHDGRRPGRSVIVAEIVHVDRIAHRNRAVEPAEHKDIFRVWRRDDMADAQDETARLQSARVLRVLWHFGFILFSEDVQEAHGPYLVSL
ncbi:MAG: hypothetical protein QM270_01885 [Bacillota bacterium]|nr:hypothetical protein [Bacillota bacterium]